MHKIRKGIGFVSFWLPLLFVATGALGGPARTAESDRYWPQWRGPAANGVSPHGEPPIHWSEDKNIRFKVPIPGRGLASPVVWKDRIFVLTAIPSDPEAAAASQNAAEEKAKRKEWPPSVDPVKQRFVVMALARDDGRVLWERTAVERTPHETHFVDGSWASASPVTDGKRLIAHFGSSGTFAYDLDGKLLWHVDLGDMTTRRGFGEGSSPVLHGDTVIINWDHEGDSFLVALDAKTGKERWKADRPDEVTSWSTPLVVNDQVIVAATGKSRGYDLASGRELWRLGGMTVNTIPSPVFRDGVVYFASGFRGDILQAVELEGARGDLDGTAAVLWTHDRHTPYVPSLLLYDDKIYFLKRYGDVLTCLDAGTGKTHYTETRLPGIRNVYASPVGAAGRVYVFDREGHAVVFRHGETFEVLAENDLDDGGEATPAIVDGDIYLRTHGHLYAIGARPAASKK